MIDVLDFEKHSGGFDPCSLCGEQSSTPPANHGTQRAGRTVDITLMHEVLNLARAKAKL